MIKGNTISISLMVQTRTSKAKSSVASVSAGVESSMWLPWLQQQHSLEDEEGGTHVTSAYDTCNSMVVDKCVTLNQNIITDYLNGLLITHIVHNVDNLPA